MELEKVLNITNVWTYVKIRELKNSNIDIVSDLLVNINSRARENSSIEELYSRNVCAIQVIENALVITII